MTKQSPQPNSDHHLIVRVQNGNTEAYSELVRKYQTGIFKLLWTLLRDRAMVEDVAQDAFVRAFQAIGTLEPTEDIQLGPWFYTIAKNLAYTALKKQRTAQVYHSVFTEHQTQYTSAVAPAETALVSESAREVLHAAIAQLPARFRNALVLSCLDELTHEEVAAIEGCSPGTVKSRIFRAKQKLQKILRTPKGAVVKGNKDEALV